MNRNDPPPAVSMAALAQFAMSDQAAELIEAFSLIPPGPMREAVVHLARTTAATYVHSGGAAAPKTIPVIGQKTPAAAPALRLGRLPDSDSPQSKAVQLRMDAPELSAKEIADRVGLQVQQVHQAVYEARKAGVPIPKKTGGGTRIHFGDEPPKRIKAKPKGKAGRPWHTDVSTLSGQGLAQITKAARFRGITPEQYFHRRDMALKMAMEGASYDRILDTTGERDSKVVSAWLSAARAAGFHVPYVTFLTDAPNPAPEKPQEPPKAVAPPEPPPAPVEAPMARVFRRAADMSPGASIAVHKAAQRRGITLAAYEDLRESIVLHRRDGKTPSQIAGLTGQNPYFIRDTLEAAEKRGAVFPPYPWKDGAPVSVEVRDARDREAG